LLIAPSVKRIADDMPYLTDMACLFFHFCATSYSPVLFVIPLSHTLADQLPVLIPWTVDGGPWTSQTFPIRNPLLFIKIPIFAAR
jgi:hypothetical protein